MIETLMISLLEGVILLFGLAFGVAFFIGACFLVVAPIVLLVDFLYGKLKLRWYRMYFDIKPIAKWKSRFIYNRLFRERWWMWLNF